MNYLIEGEVVDTRGGWTWLDVWYEVEDEKYYLYKLYYGYRSCEWNDDKLIGVYDSEEKINEIMNSGDYY